MPSREAVEALQNGVSEWDKFRINRKNEIIDLSFLNLAEYHLTNLNFSNCDLTGANIQGSSLDGSVFNEIILHGSKLSNTSLISCDFKSSTANRANFEYAIIRNSTFTNMNFVDVDFTGVTISNSRFYSCYFENCVFGEKSELFHVEFVKSSFLKDSFAQALINLCTFNKVSIVSMFSSESEFKNCKFLNSHLENFNQREGLFYDTEINQLRKHL